MSKPSGEVPPWIEVRNVTDKSADVFIYDAVGSTDSAADALAQLRALKVPTINVRINSPGGSVFGGLAVYNTLREIEATIIVHVDGIAASIASAIAMAGDEIVMAQNAMMMIHAPSGIAIGGAEEMRATAGMMDKIAGNLAQIYQARSGMKAEAVTALMETDSWLTAAECLARGLCTSIVQAKQIEARFDLSRFKNVPAGLGNQVDARRQHENAMSKPNENAAPAAPSAPVAQSFTAEAVAAQVQSATEAAHSAARAQLDSLRAELNGTIAAKDREIESLKSKLATAETLSAANIGAAPVAHIAATTNAEPKTPAAVLAHYRSLSGDARTAFFDKNKDAIWEAHDAELSAAPAR